VNVSVGDDQLRQQTRLLIGKALISLLLVRSRPAASNFCLEVRSCAINGSIFWRSRIMTC
jgi:hypothetical protein